jgi:hypothetical protein
MRNLLLFFTSETSIMQYVGFLVLKAMVMKSRMFWDISCSPLKFDRRFGGTYLHLHGWRIRKVRNQYEVGRKQSWFFPWLTLQSWRWRRNFVPKRRLTFIGLHGVISQKTELFLLSSCLLFQNDENQDTYKVNYAFISILILICIQSFVLCWVCECLIISSWFATKSASPNINASKPLFIRCRSWKTSTFV